MSLEGGFVGELEKRMIHFEMFSDFVDKKTLQKFEKYINEARPDNREELMIELPATFDRLLTVACLKHFGNTENFFTFYEHLYTGEPVSDIEKKREVAAQMELKTTLTAAVEQLYSGKLPDILA